MKKLLLILMITLTTSIFVWGQQEQQKVFKDYGNWNKEVNSNTISIDAYITIEDFLNKNNNISYRYSLVLESYSLYNGDRTGTWLYGARVFKGNKELTKDQFPDGFISYVDTTETIIYEYETPKYYKTDSMKLYITWDKAIYENRIKN